MVGAEQAILAQERTWLDRWSSGDPLGLLEIAAQEVTYLDDIGSPHVVGVEALRSYLAAFVGNIPAHQYEIVAPDVRVHGDVGILTYRYRPLLPDGGRGMPRPSTG